MTILGPDLSHYQGLPNFGQVRASGRDFAILKATESVASAVKRAATLGLPKPKTVRPVVHVDGVRHVLKPRYVDPTLATNRRNAHAAGLIVGLYHFARAGNAAAEAAYFLQTIGALQPGEFLVLDWEVPGANPPAWCQQWLDAVRAATGVAPLIYMNQSAVRGSNWTQVAGSYGLWLAVYDGALTFPAVPYWGVPAMKQYSDAVNTPGVGLCDANVFNGTRDQLLAYGKGGPTPPPPPPPPTVQEDDMRLIHTPDNTIWKLTEFSMEAEGDPVVANALAKAHGVPVVSMEYAEKDPVYLDAYARRNKLIADTAAAIGQVQAPVIDEAKLAAALLADPAAVQALGKAIADNLQLAPRASA